MKWPWKKKSQTQEINPEDLSLEQLETMFNNVIWARTNISALLETIADHESDGHDCPPYCLPEGMGTWLSGLPPKSVLVLLTVMLKDTVLTEDAGDSESEDSL